MTTTDSQYIQRCIQLAKLALGHTYPNPMVGSVIVHDGKIIGEGYHKKAGTPHAEINAINSVENKALLKESTIYVSLEPCAHYGKTPPCAEKIIELGFKKVVIGAMDSHDQVNGKGKAMIEKAGIEVQNNVQSEECRQLNKRFFTYHEKKRPYIILKWAQSADGFLDKDFKPTSISNASVNQMVHQLRADEHAILVGTNTAINDNPSLTVRHVTGVNPVRVVIDLDLKLPKDSALFNNESSTIIINGLKNEDIGHLKYRTIDKENFLKDLLQILYKEQIQSIIIEGGAKTLQMFIDENIWDETIVITNSNLQLIHGTKAPIFERKIDSEQKIENNLIQKFYNHS